MEFLNVAQLLGNLGEFVGAIAVVITLIYLSIQLRQTNRQSEAAAQTAFMEGWNREVKGFIKDPSTIISLRKGFGDFSSLSKDEKAIFQQRLAALTNQWLLARDLNSRGLLPDALCDGATDVLVSIYATPGGLDLLERIASSIPGSSQLLDAARRADTQNWSVMFPWWTPDLDNLETT